MSFASSVKSGLKKAAQTAAEFHEEMVVECITCNRVTLKTPYGTSTICETCKEQSPLMSSILSLMGAERPMTGVQAAHRFASKKWGK